MMTKPLPILHRFVVVRLASLLKSVHDGENLDKAMLQCAETPHSFNIKLETWRKACQGGHVSTFK